MTLLFWKTRSPTPERAEQKFLVNTTSFGVKLNTERTGTGVSENGCVGSDFQSYVSSDCTVDDDDLGLGTLNGSSKLFEGGDSGRGSAGATSSTIRMS